MKFLPEKDAFYELPADTTGRELKDTESYLRKAYRKELIARVGLAFVFRFRSTRDRDVFLVSLFNACRSAGSHVQLTNKHFQHT